MDNIYYFSFFFQTLITVILTIIEFRNDKHETIGATKTNADLFQIYAKDFNKSYSDSEFTIRLKNFEESLEEITRLNKLHGSKVFGLTKFSDWSPEEFRKSILSGLKHTGCVRQHERCPVTRDKNTSTKVLVFGDIPERFDWRDKGVVLPVLDQRLCAGCWAFSIVGVMESMAAISGAGRVRRSVQEVLDCSEYNNGCQKGDIRTALEYLCLHDYPIVREKKYPLTLRNESCRMPRGKKVKGLRIAEFWNTCNVNDEVSTVNDIVRTIATHGPVVAAVNAAPWRNYINGVIKTACEGSWGYLNHVIQIVGYDLTASVPYYLIRNSMGADFGDDGYVKVAIGGNVCGVANYVAYLTVQLD